MGGDKCPWTRALCPRASHPLWGEGGGGSRMKGGNGIPQILSCIAGQLKATLPSAVLHPPPLFPCHVEVLDGVGIAVTGA